jgi:hypothetical protein
MNPEESFPVEGGTFNHRYEAVLAAHEEQPENPKVLSIIHRGFKDVQMIEHDIPPAIWKAFIDTHNTFHTGSGANHLDYLEETLLGEALFEADCTRTGLHANHPSYKSTREKFLVKHSILAMLSGRSISRV